MKTKPAKPVSLADFVENPDNPQTVTAEDFAALVESLRAMPETLAANKIAYITDYVALDGTSYADRRVVIAGNKRLRALKELRGAGGQVPADWFFDLTPLGNEARRRWLVKSNVQSGEWDAQKLLELYGKDELAGLVGDDAVQELLQSLEPAPSPAPGTVPAHSCAGSPDPADADDEEPLAQSNPEYAAFVDKFKPKLTTDDCYTPDNVYAAVADYVAETYGLDRAKFVRPFWPGADYEHADYPPGCVVVDNPPFSILSKIVRFYQSHSIPFFLFAPALTLFSTAGGSANYISLAAPVIYKNGANVSTSFVTSLGRSKIASAPKLYQAIKAANLANSTAAELPKYEYPLEVATPTRIAMFSKYGIDFKLDAADCAFARALDAQKDQSLFGGGFLVSQKAAAEKAAAEKAAVKVWQLSERERDIIAALGK